jgi:hypothetical protein
MFPEGCKNVERNFGSVVCSEEVESRLVKMGGSVSLRWASGGPSFEVVGS